MTNISGAPLPLLLMLGVGVLVLNVLIALIFGFNFLFDTILKQVNRYCKIARLGNFLDLVFLDIVFLEPKRGGPI